MEAKLGNVKPLLDEQTNWSGTNSYQPPSDPYNNQVIVDTKNGTVKLNTQIDFENYESGYPELRLSKGVTFKKINKTLVTTNQTYQLVSDNTGDDRGTFKGTITYYCQTKNLDIRLLGNISDDKKLMEYYSLADAFIIPSREDNLPNVMLESFACGTPVIGFPIGGVNEHVIDYQTGLLAKDISSDALAECIKQFSLNHHLFNSLFIGQWLLNDFFFLLLISYLVSNLCRV
jgi:glycosyltransferase involved in cell wall biosynthesis